MNEQQAGDALPSAEHHEGGFRPMSELIKAAVDISRGGPHYGALIEQIRGLMDRARLISPTDDAAVEAIGVLKELNDKLDAAVVEEWSAPALTRWDLPARGNITLPPIFVDHVDRDGVEARIVFRTFHLGGNQAAHGGHIGLGFDDLLGLTAAVHAGGVTRTASLTVDYRSITPLNTELTVRAWTERQEGRKVWVRATLHDGDRLCAEAHGLFIVLKPGQP